MPAKDVVRLPFYPPPTVPQDFVAQHKFPPPPPPRPAPGEPARVRVAIRVSSTGQGWELRLGYKSRGLVMDSTETYILWNLCG